MLLLDDADIPERRTIASGPLAPLFESLRAELDPLVRRGPELPPHKALLSRAGGRCARDGTQLEFDPWSRHEHRCAVCGETYRGEEHDRAWTTSYQLWLAERAVHAALLHVLRPEEALGTLARDILSAYADRYLSYPNRDNVLGPTRLFFSTYLESIWLLQICVATDLLSREDAALRSRVVERVIEPSRRLIAEYDEGTSNRQVWNNAALLAAAALLGDSAETHRRLDGSSGLATHLRECVFADGTWYEGENYHQFALRGLWYGVTIGERSGWRMSQELDARLRRAFAAPFVTALPDFTMPSRKDSQYAVSLRQWRIAEQTELGYARSRDTALAAALARCYEPGLPRRDTGRARSTADVERNLPASALSRADLGWRALFHAVPELPTKPPRAEGRSALLEGQGYALFRRAPDTYVGVEFGQSGGGHGHPDRLNVTLVQNATRWLDDLGTSSYVDPSLHWYRSTLAHNAPMIDGRSQPLRDGRLVAWDEREGLGWIVAELPVSAPEVRVERAIVVAPEYLVDELRWFAPGDVRIDLPWHLDAVADASLSEGAYDGGDGLEDGIRFVTHVKRIALHANRAVALHARRDDREVRLTLVSGSDAELFEMEAPGQPSTTSRRFFVLRSSAREGLLRAVVAWEPARVGFEPAGVVVELESGERHSHRRDASGWHVALAAAGARSSIDLAGLRASTDQPQPPPRREPQAIRVRRGTVADGWLEDQQRRAGAFEQTMGEAHYRRSEQSWSDAGRPSADVRVAADERHLVIFARIAAGEPRFASPHAMNPYDNEHADTMAAGAQLYVRVGDATGAWMLVPDGDAVRVRALGDWEQDIDPPRARWRRVGDGWELRADVELPKQTNRVDLDLIVNETAPARERRRGQLVLSGARGEWVYLRGDRQERDRLLRVEIEG